MKLLGWKGHHGEPPSLCFEELSLSTDCIIDSIKDVRALRGLLIQAEAEAKLFAQYHSGMCTHGSASNTG